jgi:hypothetical protein
MDIAAWLQALGLERYVPAFRDNEIDWDALPKLKDFGVVLGGHRRRLLDAIAALGATAPAASATVALRDAPAPAEAERRQLTVMFCDLVGSTALGARLDPEALEPKRRANGAMLSRQRDHRSWFKLPLLAAS